MNETKLVDNAFTRTLHEIRNGDCLNEASSELAKLITAVCETGRKGKIILTLKIEPAGSGVVTRIFLEDTIKLDCPKMPKARALFFTTENGGLLRRDPNQIEMNLKVISAKEREQREQFKEAAEPRKASA